MDHIITSIPIHATICFYLKSIYLKKLLYSVIEVEKKNFLFCCLCFGGQCMQSRLNKHQKKKVGLSIP